MRFDSIKMRFLIVAMLFGGIAVSADVLLNDKDPVDRGTGDVVGNEVRWRDCNGVTATYKSPPYSVIKHDRDCKPLGPQDIRIKPRIFGLICKTFQTNTSGSCAVGDADAAGHFFEGIAVGERVTYYMSGDELTLTRGDAHVVIDTKKWRERAKVLQK